MSLTKLINFIKETKKKYVIATIIDRTGSTPQVPGAKICVNEEHETFGSVGGGSIEQKVIENCKNMMANNESFKIEFYSLNAKPGEEGDICGGTMKVMFECSDFC
jgi:xanthine dehydrogenase accessory factor